MLRLVALLCALLIASGARAEDTVDWSKAETISLMLVDDRFVPDHLTLQHGQPYLIHMENHGANLHQFTAAEFFADAIMRDPGLLQNGKDVLVLSQWAVDLFVVASKPGKYPLICADHDWDGMVGEIVVE